MDTINVPQVNPSKILQIGLGFWASKTLLVAVNLGLFTHLAEGAMRAEDIKNRLGLHDRSLFDFLDTLTALGFLERKGFKENALYSNTAETGQFLDRNKPAYIGGMLEMANNRLFPFWNDLEEALKTGAPQNETKDGGTPIFEALYSNEDRLREFLRAMGGIQAGNFSTFASQFDFSRYKTLCDVGGAGGHLSIHVAKNNDHIHCISFDLPPVTPVARENIQRFNLDDRIELQSGNFFEDDLPNADVITMGNVLHDWGTADKKLLIQKAYKALPKGGSLVVIENIIDDQRRENAFGLMMSLNMLIETEDGFDFTADDFDQWARESGFQDTEIMPLTGPSSAVIAIK